MFPSSRLQTGLAIGMLCGIALTLASGCGPKGPKTAPVRGTITYLGLPVPSGTVMFQPADGPAAYGQIKDGAYVLSTPDIGDGAVLGLHKVTVIAFPDQTGLLPEHQKPLPAPLVPFDYSFPDKSGLTAQVEDRPNEINFNLEKK